MVHTKLCVGLGRFLKPKTFLLFRESCRFGLLVFCGRRFWGGFHGPFFREAADRIVDVLSKIDALVDWRAFSPLMTRGLGGPVPADRTMAWLSDPKLERVLKVRLDFMVFCGFDLRAPVPDETTHCRFRNALVKVPVPQCAGQRRCLR